LDQRKQGKDICVKAVNAIRHASALACAFMRGCGVLWIEHSDYLCRKSPNNGEDTRIAKATTFDIKRAAFVWYIVASIIPVSTEFAE
jgi:hypothetical protein